MMLKLTFLGTSSGTPTRQRNVSGLAVQTVLGSDWFLVDCGEGTQHRVQQTPLSLNDLAAVCITHVHGDHCYGLPGLLASAGMGKRTKPLKLVAPQPVWEWFEATRRLTDLHLPYEIEHVDPEAGPLVHEAPGLRIERHVLRHRVPSHAYRIQVQTRRVRLKVEALRAAGLPQGPAWRALQDGDDVPFNGAVLRSADFAETHVDTASAVLGGDNAEPALLRGPAKARSCWCTRPRTRRRCSTGSVQVRCTAPRACWPTSRRLLACPIWFSRISVRATRTPKAWLR
jgi:ribonuclease Z